MVLKVQPLFDQLQGRGHQAIGPHQEGGELPSHPQKPVFAMAESFRQNRNALFGIRAVLKPVAQLAVKAGGTILQLALRL